MKPSRKQTEVGLIPEDWDVRSIGQMFQLINGCAFKPQDWKQTGTPIIRIQNLNDPYASFNYSQSTVAERNRVEAGDLLFAWSGTIGTSFGARIWAGPSGVLNQHIFKVLPDERRITIPFSLLVFARIEEDIAKQAHGFKASFVHVKKSDLTKVKLPVPPLAEQRAIAEALSDVDALLGALDRLIAKKRDLKQAAMQQLLTGQTRLSGYHAEWKSKMLADMLIYERPDKYIVLSTDYEETGSTPVLTANKSFILGYTNERFGICDNLPAIIFDDFTTDSKYVEFPFKVKSSAIKILRARTADVNLKFVFERMRLLRHPIGEHKRYYISEYQNVEILVPELSEQTAIANVLTDIDMELASLERRQDKTRALKHGMMQELLTGRTRLVSPESVHA
ncbi:restriction endonuclease subunit S [Tardiphaga sp. 37S4]|uniref:restriction endonuclease subunit S n=1 Tax=Tardiphaga sp. 37S4 TaxID=1404741 RepID=UPI001E51707D|nr:restriction endonuclease subunit S [Tardiphaga sp. 37S4]UFS77014.1 restriction endonuclease subunit S [Tardiphaga sp. 37S4]